MLRTFAERRIRTGATAGSSSSAKRAHGVYCWINQQWHTIINQQWHTALVLPVFVLMVAAAQVALGQVERQSNQQDLALTEQRLAERYDRLEILAGRLSELSRTTQPRRAQLLRELITRSREQDVPGQFEAIADLLNEEQFSAAVQRQGALQKDLQTLLELLLQEDRDRQIESQRKRIARYLQNVKRLIRLQRGVRARTDGGDEAERLADDQQRVGDETGELRDQIDETELVDKEDAASEGADGSAGQSADGSSDASRNGESKNASGEEEDPRSTQQEPSSDDADSGDQESGDQPSGDQAQPSDKNSSPGQPSESDGQSQQNQGGQNQPPSGSPGQQSQSGQSGESSESDEQSQEPIDRAAGSLQQAQQRMQAAREMLEKAEREGAVQQQQQALNELEQAKAELERILRQLREEELERMLVSLEARFRRMLDEQVEIYEETQKLDGADESTPEHEIEIAAGRQARREQQLVAEADRALLLLREDGTSVAFPEAVEQIRQDMESIAQRLLQVRVGIITQGLEEDVIAALEEALAVLQKSLEDLREQRAQQAQQAASSEPGEQPLVDALEELRMIRGLQVRVNRRTESYGRLIDQEQAYDEELLRALDNLSQRQQRIWRATHDLDTGENR